MLNALIGRFVRLGRWATGQVEGRSPWTNVYGLARTIMAVATLITLVANDSATLFVPLAATAEAPPFCSDQPVPGLFCVLGNLEAARFIAIAILVVVASGWRPRFTGILHWWVCASLQWSATLLDGGDQVAMVLTFLLIPVTLTDGRRWHWDAPTVRGLVNSSRGLAARVVAWSALVAVRFQVAVIYYHAGVAKYRVEEWTDGTALYYWTQHPTFGAPTVLAPLTEAIAHNPTLLPLLTWTVMAFEALLAASILLPIRRLRPLLMAGILFHVGIAVTHGILSFATVMVAALILMLMPAWVPLARLQRVVSAVRGIAGFRPRTIETQVPAS